METRRILFACTFAFSAVLEYFVRTENWWQWFGGHMDSIMHLFWGLNVFLLLVVFLRWKPLSALYGVFAFQMFWEFIEILGDQFIIQPDNMLDIFWWDGIKDTVLDMIGGALGWAILSVLPKGLHGLRESPHLKALRILPLAMLPGVVIGAIIWFVTGSSPQALAVVWIVLATVYSWWKA